MLGQNKQSIASSGGINEQHAVASHQQFFGGGQPSQPAESGAMGSAAAMQALKMFTSGSGSSGGNFSQNAFVGMAMGEASKLFDGQAAQGNVAQGQSKESAVQKAGEMALKMYMQSRGGATGGASGLMGIASKFF